MLFDEPYFAYPDKPELRPTFNTSFLTYDEAVEINKQGYAIAIIPNIVQGGRTDQHVTKIRAWFCDIDYKDQPKPELDDLLDQSPLIPSFVVESKNGYHLYFLTRNPFTPSDFYTRQQLGIIEFFGADVKCRNLARLMRAPGFLHQKEEPFEVKIVWQCDAKYTEGQIEMNFPYTEPEEVESGVVVEESSESNGQNDFDRVRHHNSLPILQALSGTSAVNSEVYRFRRTSKNHYNILVNGKDSGCFIAENGAIVADPEYSGGAVEWLKWYGHTRLEALQIIKGVMGWD